jgi:predicted nucleic acid-binding Zn ribbon protein
VERIGDVLPGVLRGLGLADGLAGWRSVSEWPEAVGEAIARRTRAVSFHEGVLMVEVEGAAWRHELSVLKRDLIRRLNQRLGGAVVHDLRFTHNRGGIQR